MMGKRPVKGYHDLVKLVPLALAEAQYSPAKCDILFEACMIVTGILPKEHWKNRPIMCAKYTANLEKEIASKNSNSTSEVKKRLKIKW